MSSPRRRHAARRPTRTILTTTVTVCVLATGGLAVTAAVLEGSASSADPTTPAAERPSTDALPASTGPGSGAPAQECGTPATVGVPPAYHDVWTELAAAQAGDQGCTTVRPIAVDSWVVRLDPDRVDAWAPEDLAWVDRGDQPLSLQGRPVVVARTPVVLALPIDRMQALGGARALAAPGMLGPLVRLERRLPETPDLPAAELRIALPDPSRSLTGAVGFLGLASAAAGAPLSAAPSYVRPTRRELTVIRTEHRMRVVGDDAEALRLVAGGTTPAALTTEALVVRHNAAGPTTSRLSAAYLQGAADRIPLLALKASARRAVASFAAYLRSEPGRRALVLAGLRPPGGPDAPTSTREVRTGDFAASPARANHARTTEQVNAAATLFGFMHVRISSLVLVDVSGSMASILPGDDRTKIDLVRTAAHDALQVASPSARSGLLTFHSAQGTDRMLIDLPVRLARNGARGSGGSHADHLLRVVDGLAVSGGTPLYDAVRRGYRYALEHHESGYVNQLVVLSDGENRDARGSITRDTLLRYLRGAADPERPVRIIAVGIGPDADLPTLWRIAAATRGKAVWLQSASQYADVLREALFTS